MFVPAYSLPPDDEKGLARYFRDISRFELLDRKTEAELARRAREEGDEDAVRQLVRGNLRFVVDLAARYRNLGLPLSDLISEGNLGLVQAARRFDERKGVKFISYAVWWIRQAILFALSSTSRPIRIPMNRINELIAIEKCRREFETERRCEPTEDELAERTGIPAATIRTLSALNRQLSLNESPGRENASEYIDLIEDGGAADPLKSRDRRDLSRVVREELDGLAPNEAEVLRLYFGINREGRRYSLAEIGRIFGLTRERIRQIKENAVKRLRLGTHRTRFEPFLS